jgi:two-component system capsular synthesis sensor histidine kinase RcsC
VADRGRLACECAGLAGGRAGEYLRFNLPHVIVATDEYELGTLEALRELRPVTVVRATLNGPHRPQWRAEGILEITEFSHSALLACVRTSLDSACTGTLPAGAVRHEAAADESTVSPRTDVRLRGLVGEDNPLNQTLITE